MQLAVVRISNFWSFGPEPVEVKLDSMTYLLGPNGAGKTAVLTALARMFGTTGGMRAVLPSDFHVAMGEVPAEGKAASLWIETDFTFPEVKEGEGTAAVPIFFSHMQLQSAGEVPGVRIRLTAEMDESGEIEQRLEYVLAADEDGAPTQLRGMPKLDRQAIQVHYLPARRNPADHIAYSAASLLGRALRAADWTAERTKANDLSEQLGEAVTENAGVAAFGKALTVGWGKLHKGKFFAAPSIAFGTGGLAEVLKQVSVRFSPGHETPSVDFERLSDGQQSLLYISLVLAAHAVDVAAFADDESPFDRARLRPAAFTLLAVEEPENSLSPQYLGRVIQSLRDLKKESGGQAIVATHSPAILRRATPDLIRHLRLDADRTTQVSRIVLPDEAQESGKFVRQAVMAYPEVYFAKLVVLGEGDSEDIVLHRMLGAMGIEADAASVCVAPLGGRHINHFWRLLSSLSVPYVTLLDLDYGRFGGGWGRIRTAHRYLRSYPNGHAIRTIAELKVMSGWKASCLTPEFKAEREFLMQAGVFFASPIDLDYAMIMKFPETYGIDQYVPTDEEEKKSIAKAVLGKNGSFELFEPIDKGYFRDYHRIFKLGSKPAAHLQAMSKLTDEQLLNGAPKSLKDLCKRVVAMLAEDVE
ncbi:Fis family transcriptional regulator (plasmid) [Xanthomonas citri pv. aurantifolii]|nr:Fis family transcriptional regulator [Xanthomonas citri pv. aurantifolii]EFF49348.1 SMC domain protein [Xanthomonas citri pv. aurantifolii str. ICPB 10535]TBX02054.1 Fis family transcriptional regulator [Xanthomonas citri pv. aurantifolii]